MFFGVAQVSSTVFVLEHALVSALWFLAPGVTPAPTSEGSATASSPSASPGATDEAAPIGTPAANGDSATSHSDEVDTRAATANPAAIEDHQNATPEVTGGELAAGSAEQVTPRSQPATAVAGSHTAAGETVYAVEVDDDPDVHVEREPLRYRAAIPMTAAGFSILGVSYAISSLTGAIVADTRDGERLDRYGRRMLIPVAGPWLAIGYTDSATAAWFTGLAGVAQTAGLVVGTIGAVHLAQRRRMKREYRVAVTGSPTLGGGQLGVVGRF